MNHIGYVKHLRCVFSLTRQVEGYSQPRASRLSARQSKTTTFRKSQPSTEASAITDITDITDITE
jgi:hypothetical protein